MDRKNKTDKKTATQKTNIKVKRARRRLYESVQEDDKYNVSSDNEEKDNTQSEQVSDGELSNKRDEVEDKRLLRANEIVSNNVCWAMGAGIFPLPLLDMALITLVQLRLLRKLSNHYEIGFSENLAKSLIASLIGGSLSGFLGGKLLVSLSKNIPGIGFFVGMTTMSITAGAITYAVGRVFIQHFESGGTFLDFDPKKVREYFMKQFEEGKIIVKETGTD